MTKWGYAIAVCIAVVLLGAVFLYTARQTQAPGATTTPVSARLDDLILVDTPLPNTQIEPPLHITGRARGSWFFEATAPALLVDANGTVVAQGPITARGEWTTTDYVLFEGTLTFPAPATQTGTLILKNDNPSGDPSKQQELDIPVRFY